MSAIASVLLKIGESGPNEPIPGGALIFVAAGVTMLYLGWVRSEMNAEFMLRYGGFVMLLFGALALFWPQRPWPH